MTNVSFQGERGAYSEAAARSFFNEDIETVPLSRYLCIMPMLCPGHPYLAIA